MLTVDLLSTVRVTRPTNLVLKESGGSYLFIIYTNSTTYTISEVRLVIRNVYT